MTDTRAAERLALLERYAYWPHPPRDATRAQVARFAFGSLAGAHWTEVRSGDRLEAAVARVHLPWDSEKLGVPGGRIACIVPTDTPSGGVHPVGWGAAPPHPAVLGAADAIGLSVREARDDGYGYLFTRVDAADLGTVQTLEHHGFRTVDAILSQYLRVDSSPAPVVTTGDVQLREATPEDADVLADITDASLTMSRFHCDPWVGVPRARALYREWARNSVRGLNDFTVLAELAGKPIGFLSAKDVRGAREAFGYGYARIELVAVLDGYRGRGIVQALTAHLAAACSSRGWGLCGIGTQISNVRAIRAYARAGFTPGDSIFSMRWVP